MGLIMNIETDLYVAFVSEFMGRKVIDGDISDLDNLRAGHVVVGLRAKGKAKKDQTGFVVDSDLIAMGG